MSERGRGVRRNATEAMRLFRLAAAQGLTAAQHNVGRAYATGLGVGKNQPEAARWYRMAAEQGDPAAQNALAILKATGRGSLRDPDATLDLFRRAATSGYSLAQLNLAAAFDHSRLVAYDPLRATSGTASPPVWRRIRLCATRQRGVATGLRKKSLSPRPKRHAPPRNPGPQEARTPRKERRHRGK